MHQMQTTIREDGQREIVQILTCAHCLEQIEFEDVWYIWGDPDPLPKSPYQSPISHIHEKCLNDAIFYRNLSQRDMKWYGYRLKESLTASGRQKKHIPTYTIDPAQCIPPKIPLSSLRISDTDKWLASFVRKFAMEQESEFLNGGDKQP